MAEKSLRDRRHATARGLYHHFVSAGRVRFSLFPSRLFMRSHSVHRVSGDEEKNIILLRLLEYLGHPNPYVCAVAYNEVSARIP